MSLEVISQAVLCIFLVVCVIVDIRTTKIPNALTFPVAILGMVLNYCQYGRHGIEQSALGWILGAGVILAVNILLPVKNKAATQPPIGMGDAKMLAAIGAMVGAKLMLIVLLYFCLCFGLVSVIMIGRVLPWKDLIAAGRAIAFGADPDSVTIDTSKVEAQKKAPIPVSIAIALGTFLAQLLYHPTVQFLGFK